MAKKLYVGNISWNSTEDVVRDHFAQVGEVKSVNIITDRETGKSRGFCFVEMENADEAIKQLDGKELDGRALKVNEAKERGPRSGGSSRSGSYGGSPRSGSYGKDSYGRNSYNR